MDEGTLVSIIIPTLRREQYLVETVRCILAQRHSALEVIIVDQGGTALRSLREAGLASDPRIAVLTLPIANLHPARNTGIHYARGTLILMLDDDVSFGPDLVDQHLLGHRDSDVGAVVGRLEEEGAVYICHPSQMAKFGGVKVSGRAYPHRGGFDHPSVLGTTGSNVSFKRQAMRHLRGYDLRFDAANSFYDDLDVGYRLRRYGYRIAFRRDACMLHYKAPRGGGRISNPSRLDTQAKRIRNVTLFYLKNMGRWGLPCFLFTFTLIALKHAVMSDRPWANFRRLVRGFGEGYRLYRSSFGGCGLCQPGAGELPCIDGGDSGVPYCGAARVELSPHSWS